MSEAANKAVAGESGLRDARGKKKKRSGDLLGCKGSLLWPV